MIVMANNAMANKMAEAGIQFERICSGWYLLDGGLTLADLKAAGLMIKVMK